MDEFEDLMRKYSSGRPERDLIEHYAELYACIKTLEKLERAYSRGVFATTAAKTEYESECKSLIAQCRSNHSYILEVFPDINRFVDMYSMSCHRAVIRLQRGIPATLEHSDGGTGMGRSVADVAETTEALINLLDQLRLDVAVLEVESVKDPLEHALNCLRNITYLVPKLDGWPALLQWATKFSQMRAIDMINDDDRRQLVLDTETIYREFKFKVSRA